MVVYAGLGGVQKPDINQFFPSALQTICFLCVLHFIHVKRIEAMKTKIYALLAVMILAFTFSTPVSARLAEENPHSKTELTEAEVEARLVEMRARVAEIKAMDRSSMSKEERRALRKELREMNKQARSWGSGGVYLSVGAIIIIILVLILIL